MPKYWNTVFYDFKSQFLVIIFSNYWPSSAENNISPPFFGQNIQTPDWKSSFLIHEQLLRISLSPQTQVHKDLRFVKTLHTRPFLAFKMMLRKPVTYWNNVSNMKKHVKTTSAFDAVDLRLFSVSKSFIAIKTFKACQIQKLFLKMDKTRLLWLCVIFQSLDNEPIRSSVHMCVTKDPVFFIATYPFQSVQLLNCLTDVVL